VFHSFGDNAVEAGVDDSGRAAGLSNEDIFLHGGNLLFVNVSVFYCIIVGGEWQSFWSFLEDFEKILKNVYRFPWEGHNESSTKEKINTYPPLFIALLAAVNAVGGANFIPSRV
jgi:hypothetical protein